VNQELDSGVATPPRDQSPAGEHSVFVGVSIFVVAATFCGMLAAIWYFSVHRAMPTASALLVVRATAEFEGTTITVEGPMLPKARQATVSNADASEYPFNLPEGIYEIHITEKNGLPLQPRQFTLSAYTRATIDLKLLKEQSSPSAPR
jgi:hypothetical protein